MRIDVGNGLEWASIAGCGGWIEMPSGIELDNLTLDELVKHRRVRRLTPAEIEHAERGEGPERHVDAFDRPISPETARRMRDAGDAFRAGLCSIDNAKILTPVPGRCPCDGAGCSGQGDELHQDDDCTRALRAEQGTWAATAGSPAPQAPAGLTPEQAARYGDATATMLRRLIADYSAADAETNIAYYCSRIDEPRDRPEMTRMGDLANAQRELRTCLGQYVSRGHEPLRRLDVVISKYSMLDRGAYGDRSARYLRRVREHLHLSLSVGAFGIAIPSSDDLGPYPRSES